jgi:hypothetical protein
VKSIAMVDGDPLKNHRLLKNEWRCSKMGHLVAKFMMGKNKVVVEIKCHRCGSLEERTFEMM